MFMSLILRIAAMPMMAFASRLNFVPGSGGLPHVKTGFNSHLGITPHTSRPIRYGVSSSPEARLYMKAPARSDDDDPELGSNGVSGASGNGADGTSGAFPLGLPIRPAATKPIAQATFNAKSMQELARPPISHQAFPPTLIYGVNARELLHNWAKPDKFDEENRKAVAHIVQGYFKTHVLRKMRDVVNEMTNIFKQSDIPLERNHVRLLEAVGLVPETLESRFLESGSSAVDASVLALGVFSRERLVDDSRGSLHRKIEEQLGEDRMQELVSSGRFGHGKMKFDVFALEGLAEAPGLPERSARVLLAKIAKYAQEEHKLVVVPKRARISSQGKDLTEYYVHLGFEKVEMKDGYELLYTGTVDSYRFTDKWVEDRQVMIRMDLWTAV